MKLGIIALALLCAGCTDPAGAGKARRDSPAVDAPIAADTARRAIAPTAATQPAWRGSIGQNLSTLSDWDRQKAFIDAAKNSRVPQQTAAGLQWTIFTAGDSGFNGVYTVTADELFDVKTTLGSPAKVIAPGKVQVAAGPGQTAQLHLLFPGRTALPKGVKVLRPGYTDDSAVFTTEFLDLLRNLNCGVIRSMDWLRTNGSEVTTWNSRCKVEDQFYGIKGKGGPVEPLIDLCNRLGADLWLNIPHQADDDYVRQAATLCRDKLDPHLFVWVEYSNELWNTSGGFPQSAYVRSQGASEGIGGRQWSAKRAATVARIFRDVYRANGGEYRVRPVLAGFANDESVLADEVAWHIANVGPLRETFAAVSWATYFGADNTLRTQAGLTADTFLAPGPDGLCHLERALYNVLRGRKAQAMFKLARDNGVLAVAYEGTDGFQTVNSPDVPAAVNNDPRIGPVMGKWSGEWFAQGGDVLMHYPAVAAWNKDSSYAAVDKVQDFGPKAQAIAAASAAHPHPLALSPLEQALIQLKATEAERDLFKQQADELSRRVDAAKAALGG